MNRFQQIDATNSSVGALLLPDEEVISLQNGIGLYDGKEKSLNQSSGTVYLTSHRLLYIDDQLPHRHSCALDLSLVRQTEYYAGFLKSSAKITLAFDPSEDDETYPSISSGADASSALAGPSTESLTRPLATDSPARDWRLSAGAAEPGTGFGTSSRWICTICGFGNTTSTDQSKAACALCGVTRDPSSEATASAVQNVHRPSKIDDTRLTASLSSLALSGDGTGSSQAPPSPPKSDQGGHACPICTFLNHPSMLHCEMCGSLLATEDLQPETIGARGSLSGPSTPVRKSSDTDALSVASRTPSRAHTPRPRSDVPADFVKLSFRKGGDKPFYAALKPTLKSKAWLLAANKHAPIGSGTWSASASSPARLASPAIDVDGRASSKRRVGIDGIMNVVDSSSRVQSDDMQGALKDLEALMTKAKQMVDFAEALNSKLTRQEQAAAAGRSSGDANAPPPPDQEAATLIRSSLVRLGLPAPAVTEDMAKDQAEYHLELARELAGLLLGSEASPGLMGVGSVLTKGKGRETLVRMPETDRGLVGLDEIWCVWNRARGIALVPPQALRSASMYLPDLTSPSIQLKTFDSGLAVLHTPRYSENAFAARLVTYLDALEQHSRQSRSRAADTASAEAEATDWGPGFSAPEVAERENAPVLLVTEMIEMVEKSTGLVVRDEGGRNGARWYCNNFPRLASTAPG